MGWKEQVEGWELTITAGSGSTALGEGSRLFIGTSSTVCLTSLPSIGDSFVEPNEPTVYSNILCRSINYKRTHTTDANGLTAVVSYSSAEKEDKESTEKDAESGTFSADINTLNVQGGTTWHWYTNNSADGSLTTFPFTILDADDGGPASENLPLTIMQLQRTKRIQFANDAALDAWMPKIQTYGGKLNDSDFLGFASGQVLLGSISGSKNNDKWDVDIVFICRKLNDASITKDDWQYLPTDTEGEEVYHRPVKTVPLISPGAGYLGSTVYSYMYDYADISKILETAAPVEPVEP